ncbi:MAG: hypothetical protein HQL43_16860 [Alphaproteobacteria bacterium]|nr:hypothetical protein [Alphaproteobacteria bacterium]
MDKKTLSERDICTKFITPALRQAGWDEMSQHRIVAKVDELMGLCDRLETSLTASDNTRRSLLESILHH